MPAVTDLSHESHMTHAVLLACVCAGKTKCLSKFGDCVVKHGASSATGLSMVVSGIGSCSRKGTFQNSIILNYLL